MHAKYIKKGTQRELTSFIDSERKDFGIFQNDDLSNDANAFVEYLRSKSKSYLIPKKREALRTSTRPLPNDPARLARLQVFGQQTKQRLLMQVGKQWTPESAYNVAVLEQKFGGGWEGFWAKGSGGMVGEGFDAMMARPDMMSVKAERRDVTTLAGRR